MGLLRDLQSEIEKRRLPSGGWASGQGRRAAIETTCSHIAGVRSCPAVAISSDVGIISIRSEALSEAVLGPRSLVDSTGRSTLGR